MTAPALRLEYSFADYLRFETDARERHEFVAGAILAMAGGTLEHSALAARLIALLAAQLGSKPCRVFDSNARVRVAATGNAFYPDVSVVCGKLEVDTDDPRSMSNPVVLFEVLSPTTAEYDRTDKLADYRLIESVRHIVHVSYDQREVTVHSRVGDTWTVVVRRTTESATLEAIGCAIDVDGLYRDPLG